MVAVGAKTTTSMFMPDAWTSYTPSWTSSGTNPTLGNGTSTGSYIQLGPLVWCKGRINTGSTSTYGTGEYRISVPVAMDTSLVNFPLGTAWLRDSSGADFVLLPLATNSSYVVFRPGAATFGGNASWTATTPVTLASGDWIGWSMFYEAA